MRKLLLLALSLLNVVMMQQISIGYDNEDTHPRITNFAVDKSILKTYLPQYLGAEFFEGYRSRVNSKDVISWLRKGSIDEDFWLCGRASHFHNPLLPWDQSYMTDVWWSDACVKYSAVTLATRYTSHPSTGQKIEISPWVHTWDLARATYYKALTEANAKSREDSFANTFLTLGHVLHLLQDMGVPAHARNDFTSHLISTNGGPKRQPYEYYVRNNPNLVTEVTDTPSFMSTMLTDFWDTDQYNGSNPSTLRDIGLAEFSNANFFSDFTIPNNGTTPEHTFPYPHIGGANVSGPNYQICSYQLLGGTASVSYVSRRSCPSIPKSADHFAVVSLMNSPGVSDINSISHVMLNDEVHEQYAQELLPRAIGYSAALIDYFFRGTLGISDTEVYAVADGSQSLYSDINGNQHQQFTKITAWVENTTPNEAIGPGTLTAVARYKIVPNYAPDLANYPPNGGAMMSIQEYTYSVSAAEPVSAGDFEAGYYTSFSFDFGSNPIPAGITDLTLQLVFKGTIGNETDNAIAVGMKNLAEPTHLTFWNSSDMFNLQYTPYTGPTYLLYTYQQLEQQAHTDTNFLNYIDFNHSGILSDDPILQPYDSTFTISFWDGYDWITATTVNIPQARHIRMIALVNSETTNYVKMDFSYPGGSNYVVDPFQGAKYSTVPPVKTFRKRKADDGSIVPFYQHFSRTVIGCYPAQGVDANGNAASCPYADDQALPIENATPVSFTSEFD